MAKKKKNPSKPVTAVTAVAPRSKLPKRVHRDKVKVFVGDKSKTAFRKAKKLNPLLTRKEWLA